MNITLNNCGPSLTTEQIHSCVGVFPNCEFFYTFYQKYNGGDLDQIYVLDEKKIFSLKPKISCCVSDFFKLTSNKANDISLFSNELKIMKSHFPHITSIYSDAFPFANDPGNNIFWINKTNGTVIFFPRADVDEENQVTVIASTFQEFIYALISSDDYERENED